mgnify:CR=1 FL=1
MVCQSCALIKGLDIACILATTDPADGAVNLVLLGGTKKKQDADIDTAVGYLNDYKDFKR